MSDLEYKIFMDIQRHKIEVDKWYEGIKIHDDPGSEYVLRWIFDHGKTFREMYIKSKCKECKLWKRCGYRVIEQCNDHKI